MKNILITLFLLPAYFLACDCPILQPLTKQVCEGYDIIFIGKVDSISKSDGEKCYAYFKIDQLFQGKTTPYISLAFDCNSDCHIEFVSGDTWLIYGKFYKYGKYQASLCSRSRKEFVDAEKDFYTATSGMSFTDETTFLKTNLQKQEFMEEQKPLNHINTQPEGFTKLWLVLTSVVFLGAVYYFGKKNKIK